MLGFPLSKAFLAVVCFLSHSKKNPSISLVSLRKKYESSIALLSTALCWMEREGEKSGVGAKDRYLQFYLLATGGKKGRDVWVNTFSSAGFVF